MSSRVMTPHLPDAVVFDCDGVLADTIACWNAAFVAVGSGCGITLTNEHLRQLSGSSVEGASERISHWANCQHEQKAVADALHEQLLLTLDDVEPSALPGVRDLLDELSSAVPVAVASNAPRAVLRGVLDRLQLSEFIKVFVSADDVDAPKPAPDPYLAACSGLNANPLRSFAFEDSLIGARSAEAAGLAVIEVTGPAPRDGATWPLVTALRVASLADPRLLPLILDGRPEDQGFHA